MLTRSRDGRARLPAWSETRRQTDAVAVIQTADRAEWEGHAAVQVSGDSECEVDYLKSLPAVSQTAVESNAAPVTGESFCLCHLQEDLSAAAGLLGFSPVYDCLCGEDDQGFEWAWDENHRSTGTILSCENRKVSFHSDYSCGTAAIRGTAELSDGQHFWEVKMTSPVYGTDMMVGIGSSEVNMEKFKYSFVSLLGHDEDSWGLSYTGLLHHKGDKSKFSSRFGHGSIIGMHLDTWHGTLTFYRNRHFIGVAATRLQNKKFYPMVCSTAARSSMKVIRSCYTPTSLQYLCCARVRQMLPRCPDVLGVLKLPPGLHNLLRARLGWLFSLSSSRGASEQSGNLCEDLHEEMNPSLSPSPESILSACTSPDLCPCPFLDTVQYQCCRQTAAQEQPCSCHCPPTPPNSDYDSCCSEPEDYQCKRCRWT